MVKMMNIQLRSFNAKKWVSIKKAGRIIPNATSIMVTMESTKNTPQILLTLDLNFNVPLKIANLCSCAIFYILKNLNKIKECNYTYPYPIHKVPVYPNFIDRFITSAALVAPQHYIVHYAPVYNHSR